MAAQHEPIIYRIVVTGALTAELSSWFADLTVATDAGITILTGPVADQSALRGLLTKLWDLNLTLLAVERMVGGAEHDREGSDER